MLEVTSKIEILLDFFHVTQADTHLLQHLKISNKRSGRLLSFKGFCSLIGSRLLFHWNIAIFLHVGLWSK